MIKSLFFICLAMCLGACSHAPKVITITPPLAYLQLPPKPIPPGDDATNLTLSAYLFELYDSDTFCRRQISTMSQWIEKQKPRKK